MFSLCLFLFRRREGSEETIRDRARGCRLHKGATNNFITHGVTTEEAKRLGPVDAIKRHSKHEFYTPHQPPT
jgi:hypothetical protein